jgi:GT2 family glycosyltransferase
VPERTPTLSVIAPVWNELEYTRRFVESVRAHTDVDHELILVDNGSNAETAVYLDGAADIVVRNPENRGYAVAMNQGLERAGGRCVAFCNNDTVLPERWASRLVEHLERDRTGIVVPAVTHSLRRRNVRDTPGEAIEALDPFESSPAAVVYVMRTETARALGGFSEEYDLASGEDVDLAFTIWVNGLDIVYDSRVLVAHASKGTARNLGDWHTLWRRNRDAFLVKWTGAEPDVPRLPGVDPEAFSYRLAVARSVAGWMGSYYRSRDKVRELRASRAAPGLLGRARRRLRSSYDRWELRGHR